MSEKGRKKTNKNNKNNKNATKNKKPGLSHPGLMMAPL